MKIREILESKKIPHTKTPNSVLGKHKFNGNYDSDKFKFKKKEEKAVKEETTEEVVEAIAEQFQPFGGGKPIIMEK